MDVKAIYKIPDLRQIFLIVPSLDELSDKSQTNQESKTQTEYLEHILHEKSCILPIEIQQWTLKVMSHKDFVSAIKQRNPKGQVLSNQSSLNDPELELLAINLIKTSSDNESKNLSFIDESEIIEVFI